MQPAKILRIHVCESDRHEGKPLWQAILAKCRQNNIAGATVFRGVAGFGETAELHRHHLMAHEEPVVIVIVDTPENIARLQPEVEPLIATGMLAVSNAEMLRVTKNYS